MSIPCRLLRVHSLSKGEGDGCPTFQPKPGRPGHCQVCVGGWGWGGESGVVVKVEPSTQRENSKLEKVVKANALPSPRPRWEAPLCPGLVPGASAPPFLREQDRPLPA